MDVKELRIEFMRASGPGGQSVNTTDSACRVTHMPTGTIVTNQDQKNQESNKQRALNVMKERLFQLEFNKHMKVISEQRRGQISGTDRSDKIRTYNFPQDRITGKFAQYLKFILFWRLFCRFWEDFDPFCRPSFQSD